MSAFFTVALIHILGAMSPGPDFAIIVQQSITQKRSVVLWTVLGISLGLLVHVSYSLLGIGFIIAQSIFLFTVIKLLGATYLIFIGWKSLSAESQRFHVDVSSNTLTMSGWQGLRIGFLCNALNPKCSLFFLALFTQVIDPATPTFVLVAYGVWMAFATFVWFASLAYVLTTEVVRRRIEGVHLWAERIMGAVLIALGLKVALSTRS